jgi:hypothetical protein
MVGELREICMVGMELGISVFGWGHTKNELLRKLSRIIIVSTDASRTRDVMTS